jgi:hypothetical protein
MKPRLVFSHEFEDCSAQGSLSFDAEAGGAARLRLAEDDEGQLRLTANREGWLHLACVAAELGRGDYPPGFTLRLDYDFRWGAGGGPEIVLERSDEEKR